jgi:glycosyltransferase involved in cell wall biosynthesis
MMPPLLSVIVPARNAMPYLPEALASIRAQAAPRLEIVMVDGASSDGSREAAAAFPGVRMIDQAGLGLAAARNSGLAAARGDLIAFLDADDLWPAGSLAGRVAYLAQHPDCAGVSGQVVRFLQPGTRLPPAYAGDWLDQPVPGYTPGALLARRSVFEQAGPFDPNLTVGCDSDWFARAIDQSINLVIAPQITLHKRIHEGNLSAQIATYRRELLTVARRSLQRRGILSPGGEQAARHGTEPGAG